MPVEVYEVVDKKGMRQFADLPRDIYRGDPEWVPPLKSEIMNTLRGKGNPLIKDNPHVFLLARSGGNVVGRLCAGINQDINNKKQRQEGYISLFEAVDDRSVASAILGYAMDWLRQRGINMVKGPVSPTHGGDDYRGMLVDGFNGPPVFMNSYNPPYYSALFESCGFEKYEDYYAYRFDAGGAQMRRLLKSVAYAQKRYGYYIKDINLWQANKYILDIKEILDQAMPEFWADLTPPSVEDIRSEGRRVMPVFRVGDGQVAYSRDHKPIGFMFALGDYNQVLKKLDGSLLPFGVFTFLWRRRKITGARIFNLFVIPAYENKGVVFSFFANYMLTAQKRGYSYVEGSTIGESNLKARRVVEKAGGVHYRTYRIYCRKL